MPKPKPKALFIGYVFPEPTSSAAGVRTIALIEEFQAAGYAVHFSSPSQKNAFAEALEGRGVPTVQFAANDSAFDSFVRELSPAVVVYDRFVIEEQFGWRVSQAAPDAMRITDTQDLHTLRRAREAYLKSLLVQYPEAVPHAELQAIYDARIPLDSEDGLREFASIYRSDLTLVLSDFEMRLLTDRFRIPADLLLLHPFSYGPSESAVAPSTLAERRHLVCIGNFRHPPNRDAVWWMKREIWPRLRTLLRARGDAAELHIYGSYPPKDMMELDSKAEGFRVFGPCEDAVSMLTRYRVMLAPLRFGAGIKGKIADAWSAGTPVVTTPIGSEGMEGSPGAFAGIVARSVDGLVQASASLLEDAALWTEKSREGRDSLAKLFDPKRNRMQLFSRLETVRGMLAEHRQANLIGRMLQHHQHQSTVYFSRWIELKNQMKGSEERR